MAKLIGMLLVLAVAMVPLRVHGQETPADVGVPVGTDNVAASISVDHSRPWYFIPALAGVFSVIGGVLAVLFTHRFHLRRARRDRTVELHMTHMVGHEFLRTRMKVQKLLFLDNSGFEAEPDPGFVKYHRARTFPELRAVMCVDDWVAVASMLNFFRTLNAWVEHGVMDRELARELFGWLYTWWWYHVINPFGSCIPRDHRFSEWENSVSKLEWLLWDADSAGLEVDTTTMSDEQLRVLRLSREKRSNTVRDIMRMAEERVAEREGYRRSREAESEGMAGNPENDS
jgi:hypothetical protein